MLIGKRENLLIDERNKFNCSTPRKHPVNIFMSFYFVPIYDGRKVGFCQPTVLVRNRSIIFHKKTVFFFAELKSKNFHNGANESLANEAEPCLPLLLFFLNLKFYEIRNNIMIIYKMNLYII